MAGLKAILPHSPVKTRQIITRGNKISTHNGENPKHINLSFEFSKNMGFNCTYLMGILKNLDSFTYKMNSRLGATILENGDRLRILMPLRILDDESTAIGDKIEFEIKKPKQKTRTAAMVINTIKKNKGLTGAEILNILAKENQ